MTPDPEDEFTDADLVTTLRAMTIAIKAQDSLISDLLGCMVAIDSASMRRLRTHEAEQVDVLVAGERRDEEAALAYEFHVARFVALDKVLARAGFPMPRTDPPSTGDVQQMIAAAVKRGASRD